MVIIGEQTRLPLRVNLITKKENIFRLLNVLSDFFCHWAAFSIDETKGRLKKICSFFFSSQKHGILLHFILYSELNNVLFVV